MSEFGDEVEEQGGMKIENHVNVGTRVVVWLCFLAIAGIYGVILYFGFAKDKELPIFRKY